ncbi:uncharacterized protein [Ptychodera flava]|uniref:uncharacterized protein n=1 Tax=Ptychodera flava TaxID=63121 RepID=UPI00396A6569
MNDMHGLHDRLTVRRSFMRPKRQRITLCFGVGQVVLGLTIVAVSFAAFGLSTSNRVRNACPYWAGFSVLLTGGVGVIAWKQPSVLAVSFFTFLSAICVILHLVATVLSGETGSLLKSFLVCIRHDLQYTCLCCDNTYECSHKYRHVEFEGVLDCDTVPTTLKELMYTICVVNVIACLLCFVATILGCANIVKRNTGRRFLFGRSRHGTEQIDPTTIGEVIDSVFTPPVPPPPYSPPEYGEISGDPIMVEAAGYAEEIGTDAINPNELPPPYSTLDVTPDSAFEHFTSEASPMESMPIGANETSGLESCQSPITPSEHYCRIYVNPVSVENFPREGINSGITVTPTMQQFPCISDRTARKQSLTDSLPKKKIYPTGKYELEVRAVRHILATAPVQYRHSTYSDHENNNFQSLHTTAGDRGSGKFSDISKSRDSMASSTFSNPVIAEVSSIPCAIGETPIDNYISSRESVLNCEQKSCQEPRDCSRTCQPTVELHGEDSVTRNMRIPITVKTYNVNGDGHPSSTRSFQSITASLSSDSDSYDEYVTGEQSKSYPRTKKQRRRERHAQRRRVRRNSENSSFPMSNSSSNTQDSEGVNTGKSSQDKLHHSSHSISSQSSKPSNSLYSISSFKSVDVSSPTRLSLCSTSSKSRNSVSSINGTANGMEMPASKARCAHYTEALIESDASKERPLRPNSLEIKPVHNLPDPDMRRASMVGKKESLMKELHPLEIKRRYITCEKQPAPTEGASKPPTKRKGKAKARPKSLADFKSFKDAKVLVARFIEQSNGNVSPAVKSVLENIQAVIKSDEKHMAEAIHSANVLGQYTQPTEVKPKPARTMPEKQDNVKDVMYRSNASLGSRHWHSCSDIAALSDHGDGEDFVTEKQTMEANSVGEELAKTLTICKETVL